MRSSLTRPEFSAKLFLILHVPLEERRFPWLCTTVLVKTIINEACAKQRAGGGGDNITTIVVRRLA